MARGKTSAVLELEEPVPVDEYAPPDEFGPEDVFAIQLRQFKTIEFKRQLKFARGILRGKSGRGWRQWMFDFAFPKFKLAVEIEGLVPRRLLDMETRQMVLVVYGGHATITGIKEDMEKYNAAALLGWTVIRFEQKDVKSRRAIDMTLRVLATKGWRT